MDACPPATINMTTILLFLNGTHLCFILFCIEFFSQEVRVIILLESTIVNLVVQLCGAFSESQAWVRNPSMYCHFCLQLTFVFAFITLSCNQVFTFLNPINRKRSGGWPLAPASHMIPKTRKQLNEFLLKNIYKNEKHCIKGTFFDTEVESAPNSLVLLPLPPKSTVQLTLPSEDPFQYNSPPRRHSAGTPTEVVPGQRG